MTTTSRTFLLMQARYDGDLTELIRTLRRGGASWHTVSVRLAEATGVTATPETIRIWYADDPTMAKRKAGAA